MKSTAKSTKRTADAAPASAAAPAVPTPAPATELPPKITRVPKVKKAAAPAASAPAASALPPTVITARVDVGFGNALYLRGEGPGLSWNAGVPLACVADNAWTISLAGVSQPVVFKVLLNDTTWSQGPDYSAAAGSTTEVTPTF